MPVRGKHGKPNPGFPPFPPPLEIPQPRRDSHIPTALMIVPIYKVRTKTPDLKPSTVRVGQIKLPKWAKLGCQTHSKVELSVNSGIDRQLNLPQTQPIPQ